MPVTARTVFSEGLDSCLDGTVRVLFRAVIRYTVRYKGYKHNSSSHVVSHWHIYDGPHVAKSYEYSANLPMHAPQSSRRSIC
jgi:hypothetical protein